MRTGRLRAPNCSHSAALQLGIGRSSCASVGIKGIHGDCKKAIGAPLGMKQILEKKISSIPDVVLMELTEEILFSSTSLDVEAMLM